MPRVDYQKRVRSARWDRHHQDIRWDSSDSDSNANSSIRSRSRSGSRSLSPSSSSSSSFSSSSSPSHRSDVVSIGSSHSHRRPYRRSDSLSPTVGGVSISNHSDNISSDSDNDNSPVRRCRRVGGVLRRNNNNSSRNDAESSDDDFSSAEDDNQSNRSGSGAAPAADANNLQDINNTSGDSSDGIAPISSISGNRWRRSSGVIRISDSDSDSDNNSGLGSNQSVSGSLHSSLSIFNSDDEDHENDPVVDPVVNFNDDDDNDSAEPVIFGSVRRSRSPVPSFASNNNHDSDLEDVEADTVSISSHSSGGIFPPERLFPPSSHSEDEDSDGSSEGGGGVGDNLQHIFGFQGLWEFARRPPTPAGLSESPPLPPDYPFPIFGEDDDSDSDSDSDNQGGMMSARTSTTTAAAATSATGGRVATAGVAGPSFPSTPSRGSTISYECVVCLEQLDIPASIDNLEPENNNENDECQRDGTVGTPRGSGGTARRGGARGGGRGGGGRGSQSQLRRGSQNVSPTDVVATHCGHLYHQVCLEKWFTEQGKRTCPSCRKSVPKAKMIRLYPSISADTGRPRFSQDGPASPRASTSTATVASAAAGTSSSATVTAAGAPPAPPTAGGNQTTAQEIQIDDNGDCTRPNCQDLKLLHNTLMSDFDEMRERLNTSRENDDVKDATIRSLVEDNERQANEIQRLKRQLEETAPPIPTGPNKRRRQ